MRLFVAIDVGPAIADAAGGLIAELRQRVERDAPRARVNWVSPESLHVTVRFIGEVDEARATAMRTALGPALDVRRFDMTVESTGAFPGRGAPRVFWAGLTAGRDGVLEVERAVSGRLETLVPRDERGFNPHLTLARVKEPAGLASAALFGDLAGVLLGTVRVEAITLFESQLSSKGSTYVPLQRTALA
jgi:2'-5' RNA ligase